MVFINSYADAVVAGNALLYLPLELRQEIFAYAALYYTRRYNPSGCIDASDILQGRQCTWLPPMCLVNDQFCLESLPIMLRQSNIVAQESYTAYNLHFFLEATDMFPHVQSLRFNTSQSFAPLSAGAALLSKCTNLRSVWLSFSVRELFKEDFIHRNRALATFNKKAFVENYSFRELLSLKKLQKVTMFLSEDRPLNVPDGADTVWGMGKWLERKFGRRGLKVTIVCRRGSEKDLEQRNFVLEQFHNRE